MRVLEYLGTKDLCTAKALTASGGGSATFLTTPCAVTGLNKLQVYVKNTGSAATVTVLICGTTSATASAVTNESKLACLTIGAGTALAPYRASAYISWDDIPSFIYADLVNTDAVNAAEITVTIDQWK